MKEVAGESSIEIANYLRNKKNVSEFKIADALKKDIKRIRTGLYKLVNSNIVSSIRKKDKQKGWYIYYWTFNPKRVKYLMYDLKRKKLDNLKSRLKREDGNYFFVCDDNCIRLDFEQATDFNFKCPECGRLVNQEDNASKIEDIKKEIKALEREIKKRPN